MKSNVIMFPLFIETEEQKTYYGMAYHALETLTKKYNQEFDILVYYYSSTYNMLDHKNFVDSEKNIFVDFPQVRFIQFRFSQSDRIDGYFFKWNAVDHLYSLGYKKALIIDVDVIFFNNPAHLFEKYDDYHAHVLKESRDPTVIKVLGKPGIAGGQLILSTELYQSKIHNIYEKILAHRVRLLQIAEAILDHPSFVWFKTLCDQYALFETFVECEIPMSQIANQDISFGDTTYELKVKNGAPLVIPKTNIVHYLGSRAVKVLPPELLKSHLVEQQKHYLLGLPEATDEEVAKWSMSPHQV